MGYHFLQVFRSCAEEEVFGCLGGLFAMGRGGERVREGVDGVIVWDELVGGRCGYR